MGNHHHRLPLGQVGKGRLDLALVVGVREGRGLVHQNDGRVLQNHPGDGDALLLPAGEVGSPGTDHRVHSLGELVQDVPALSQVQGTEDLLPGGRGPA